MALADPEEGMVDSVFIAYQSFVNYLKPKDCPSHQWHISKANREERKKEKEKVFIFTVWWSSEIATSQKWIIKDRNLIKEK